MTLRLLLAAVLVASMGFAAHRASLCTVRAVMEVMTAGTAYMLASFAKAVLWTVVMSGSLIVVFAIDPQPVYGRLPFWAALAGGFIFGVGAAINGGCSFSTLQRLADGELGMLVSLSGMILGFLGMSRWLSELPGTLLQVVATGWHWQSTWATVLLALLWLWALWELIRLWRAHAADSGLLGRLLANRYRLSSAAAVLGIVGGTLYAVQGAWTYTNFLRSEAASWLGAGQAPAAGQALLLAALVFGMLLSSWHRGALRLRQPKLGELPPKLAGGLLMGIGGTLVPGGNDTLLLAAIPTFSAHAVAVFVALLAGVALTLAVMRRQMGTMPAVSCSGDRCQ
ncbi:MAG: hypothetical protein FD131_754 [Rhodocyclaceae bacterium]|nr:MAG: hypothetical protein FD131_754 [Rhodocyclaceae bacterium]